MKTLDSSSTAEPEIRSSENPISNTLSAEYYSLSGAFVAAWFAGVGAFNEFLLRSSS